MTRRHRVISRLATVLPPQVTAEPERVLINAICVFVGLSVFVSGDTGSPIWPRQVFLAWGALMVFGGIAALVGYWRSFDQVIPIPWATSLERFGYLSILVAALPYGIRLIGVYGLAGVPVGGAFIAIAAAKGLRLLTSTAVRDHLLQSGEATEDGSR